VELIGAYLAADPIERISMSPRPPDLNVSLPGSCTTACHVELRRSMRCMQDVRSHLLVVSTLAGILVLAPALPASAKMPPWTCELSTTRPLVGRPVTIEVRYWWDSDHSEPADMAIFRRLRALQAVAIDHGEPGEYQLGIIPIVLPRVSPSSYRGEVMFPDTRRFRVRWCGGGYDERGYPLRAGVIVSPRLPASRLIGKANPPMTIVLGLLAAGVGFAGTIAALPGSRRSRRRA
jgi:hypothetical protein